MGAIAEAFVAYGKPLLDATDGSKEQLDRAFAITQLCYNLALLPEDQRESLFEKARETLGFNDEEFADFRQSVVEPMIERHHEMFPRMPGGFFGEPRPTISSTPAQTRKASPGEKYPGTDRYAPCPCGSGEKYKFCCASKRR